MKSRKYGIIGFPLSHSFSPKIHNQAFAAYGMEAEYGTIEIPPQKFTSKIEALKREEWAGFNVTIPYKTDILPFLDELDERARQIGAVNTILVSEDGKWMGFNTDYKGFLKPLSEYKDSLKKCLVLGAGGAARAVCIGIAAEIAAQELTIANRSSEKAKAIVDRLASFSALKKEGCLLSKIPDGPFDLIVNTTSVGMGGQVAQNILDIRPFAHSQTIVYDLIYNPAQTPFLRLAEKLGLSTLNGLPMLIYQAEEAFRIWTGKGFPEEMLGAFLEIQAGS